MKKANYFPDRVQDWLNQLSEKDQHTITKLWNMAEEPDTRAEITVSKHEKKERLTQIKYEIGTAQRQEKPASSSPSHIWRWAAAAVILIAGGLSFLMYPVQISAPRGQQKTITLPDHSTVVLNSSSSVSYNRLFGYLNRDISLKGEGYFEVKHDSSPFIVHTYEAKIKVLGTKFDVRSRGDDPRPRTRVMLKEGALKLSSLGKLHKSVILAPGQQSSVQANAAPSSPRQASENHVLAWLNHRFAFEGASLGAIIHEIERRFNITINVRPKRILSDKLTVFYSSKATAEKMVRDICLSKGLHYRVINNGFVITLKSASGK